MTTPSDFVIAPVMHPFMQSGSSQWRHDTAKFMPSDSLTLIRRNIC